MIKISKFISYFMLSSIFSLQAQYHTRELNIVDDSEVSQAAKLLFYKEREVYSHTYYTTEIGYRPHTGYTKTSTYLNGQKSESHTTHTYYVPYTYSMPHHVYRPMNKQEKAAELVRAKAQTLESLQNRKNIFVCVSDSNPMVCGLIVAECHVRQIGLAEYINVCVHNNLQTDCDLIMFSMTRFAENFYRNLSIHGIAIDLRSQNPDFYLQNGYIKLSREAMISNKFGSVASYIAPTVIWTALVSAAGFCCANKLSNYENTTKAGIALLTAALSLPVISAGCDYVNNTVYYKLL